jgi:hypothetical protein
MKVKTDTFHNLFVVLMTLIMNVTTLIRKIIKQ